MLEARFSHALVLSTTQATASLKHLYYESALYLHIIVNHSLNSQAQARWDVANKDFGGPPGCHADHFHIKSLDTRN